MVRHAGDLRLSLEGRDWQASVCKATAGGNKFRSLVFEFCRALVRPLRPERKRGAAPELARVVAWPKGEAELVSALRSGSETAFDWLLTHYHARVYGVVSGMLQDPNEAANVTKEVFLKALYGIKSFQRSSSLKTWLYGISVRKALNHRRWFGRRQQSSMDDNPGEKSEALGCESTNSSPSSELASWEVQQALRGIPQVFRSAVILRDLEGLSYEEVAEVLDVSMETVKARILRGRWVLRETLESSGVR